MCGSGQSKENKVKPKDQFLQKKMQQNIKEEVKVQNSAAQNQFEKVRRISKS